jgi:hypothetical protein
MRTIKRVEKNNRIIICSLVFVPREICQPRTNTSIFCFDLSITDYIIESIQESLKTRSREEFQLLAFGVFAPNQHQCIASRFDCLS